MLSLNFENSMDFGLPRRDSERVNHYPGSRQSNLLGTWRSPTSLIEKSLKNTGCSKYGGETRATSKRKHEKSYYIYKNIMVTMIVIVIIIVIILIIVIIIIAFLLLILELL
jgi:hypothetical protein